MRADIAVCFCVYSSHIIIFGQEEMTNSMSTASSRLKANLPSLTQLSLKSKSLFTPYLYFHILHYSILFILYPIASALHPTK